MTDRQTITRAAQADIGVMPNDPLVNIEQRNAETPPEVPVEPVKLPYVRPDTYRFRTTVGHRNTEIRLRVPEVIGDVDRDVKMKKAFEKWAARTLGGDPDPQKDRKLTAAQRLSNALKVLKVDAELHERTQLDAFKFRPIPRRQEATFETTDPEIAAYIRLRITEPQYVGKVYEDVKPLAVELNGETVYVVPADNESRTRMAAYAAQGR
jgi:hypothetical protein